MVEGGVRVEFNEESCVYTVAYVSQRKWENTPLVDISITPIKLQDVFVNKNKEKECYLCNSACLSTEQRSITIEISAHWR